MVSYLKHNCGSKTCFYICETDFTDRDKKAFGKIALKYKTQVKFINCNNIIQKITETHINTFKGNYITYIRLFIGELLPEQVSKVLYLDADTMILDSIEYLFTIDMGNSVIAGAKDWISDKYKVEIGYKGDTYINVGVMLINLEEWKGKKYGQKIYDRMLNRESIYGFHDQDLINLMLYKKTILLDICYCAFFPIYSWEAQRINMLIGDDVYSESELERARNNPCIVHMTGVVVSQPWVKGNINPFSKEWIKCLDETDFAKDFVLRKNTNTIQWKIFYLLGYRIIPFNIWFKIYKRRNEKMFNRLIEKVRIGI